MKKYFLLFAFVANLFFVSCTKENTQPQPVVQVKTYEVPSSVRAMNVEVVDKSLYLVDGESGWIGRSSSKLTWGWAVVEFSNSFQKVEGEGNTAKYSQFYISFPRIPITDMSNVAASYDYNTLLALLRKGNKPLQSLTNREGFMVWFSHSDMANPKNGYSYRTEVGEQDGSQFEIVNIKELGNNQILTTYKVDCKMYADDGKFKGKLKGTIQLIATYKPL
jgi:hypothetical protein